MLLHPLAVIVLEEKQIDLTITKYNITTFFAENLFIYLFINYIFFLLHKITDSLVAVLVVNIHRDTIVIFLISYLFFSTSGGTFRSTAWSRHLATVSSTGWSSVRVRTS